MATIAAPHAHAQDAPVPNPTPVIVTPSPRPQQIPGVIPERFSIAPSPSPTPAPLPSPSPTPSAAAAVPAPQGAEAARRAAPPLRPAPTSATPLSAPTPLDTPTPLASATPVPLRRPVATAAPTAEPVPAPPWLWAAGGAGGTALLGLAGWLLLRRRRSEEDEAPFEPVPSAAAPPPPVQPPPGLARPTPAPAAPGDPFELKVEPRRVHYAGNEVVLEFDLLIGNVSGAPVENIRLGFAAISAQARQDEVIAAFHGAAPGEPSGPPFNLAAGAGGRMPVRIAIPAQGVHAVLVGGRPMFVPIVLIDLRWRAGLSIRRFGADFMLGVAGQGDKLGPLWLDRPAPAGPLGAHRYFARRAVAA